MRIKQRLSAVISLALCMAACRDNAPLGPTPPATTRTTDLDLASGRLALVSMFQKAGDDAMVQIVSTELAKNPIDKGTLIVLGPCEIDLAGHSWRLTIATPASRQIWEGTFQRGADGVWKASLTSQHEQLSLPR